MRLGFLVLLGCCTLLGTTVAAQPRPADPPRRKGFRRIGVVLLLEKKDSKAVAGLGLVQAIRSQLTDTAVRLNLHTVDRYAADLAGQLALARKTASSGRSTVVIWFRLSGAEPLYLYFVEKQGSRLIMRSFGAMEPDERAEAASIVVRSSVLAFLRGQRVGRKVAGPRPSPRPTLRKHRPPPAPSPPPHGRTRRPSPQKIWTSLELGYAYAYDDWDAGLTGHHGILARMAVHLAPQWSLLAGYRWSQLAPLYDTEDRAEVLLRLHRFFLGARFHHAMGQWEVGASIWINADYVRYTVREAALVDQTDGQALVLFSLAPTFHVGVRLVDRLRLQLEVGAEVGLYNPTLQLYTPGEINEFSKFGKPEVIRPCLMLTLAVDLM